MDLSFVRVFTCCVSSCLRISCIFPQHSLETLGPWSEVVTHCRRNLVVWVQQPPDCMRFWSCKKALLTSHHVQKDNSYKFRPITPLLLLSAFVHLHGILEIYGQSLYPGCFACLLHMNKGITCDSAISNRHPAEGKFQRLHSPILNFQPEGAKTIHIWNQ